MYDVTIIPNNRSLNFTSDSVIASFKIFEDQLIHLTRSLNISGSLILPNIKTINSATEYLVLNNNFVVRKQAGSGSSGTSNSSRTSRTNDGATTLTYMTFNKIV